MAADFIVLFIYNRHLYGVTAPGWFAGLLDTRPFIFSCVFRAVRHYSEIDHMIRYTDSNSNGSHIMITILCLLSVKFKLDRPSCDTTGTVLTILAH